MDDPPPAGTTFVLERLNSAGPGEAPERQVAIAEAIYVEAGQVLVVDNFGFEAPLPAGSGVVVRGGATYVVRNDGPADAEVMRLSLLPDHEPAAGPPPAAASPVASPVTGQARGGAPETAPLLSGPVDPELAALLTLFISRVTWAPGADTGDLVQTGPIGLAVESGPLMVRNPSGIEGQVSEGQGVVLPTDAPLRVRNAGSDDAVALMVGIVPAGSSAVEPVQPTATPTLPPTETPRSTNTPEPTATSEPTHTPTPMLPTATPQPTATRTPEPTPTVEPDTPAGTILQSGETWRVGTASLTISIDAHVTPLAGCCPPGIVISFVYTNETDERTDFVTEGEWLRVYDDLRAFWEIGEP